MTRKERRYWFRQYIRAAVLLTVSIALAVVVRHVLGV